jgi:PAS domain S-box-containing protein
MKRHVADALHRSVAEADPNLVFIADRDGRIVYVNARWVAYTGLPAEQLLPERSAPLGLVHPDDLDQTWSTWQHSLRTGEPYERSYRLRSARDGRYRWFLTRAMSHREESGEIVGWYGVATDVDDQVRATERSRFLSQAALALSSSYDRQRIIEEFMRVAVERFSDGCILAMPDAARTLRRVAVAHRDPEIEARAKEKIARTPVDSDSVIARVFDTKRSVLIPDLNDESHTGWRNAEGIRITYIFDPTRSVITVPLMIADRVGGTISFICSAALSFDEFDVETAESVAREAVTAFEHAAAFARERETTERFRYLAHATDELFATSDVNENLETLIKSLVGYWADWAALFVLEPGGAVRIKTVAYWNPSYAFVEELRGQRLFNREAERTFREIVGRHRSRLRTDVTLQSLHDVTQPFLMPIVEKVHPQSLLIVPLFTTEFDFGAIGVYLSKRNYGEEDRELFEELGRRVSLALEHATSLERERLLARTLQEVTLPAQLPQIPGIVMSTTYEPATTSDAPVGGDWYDAFELPDGRVVLSIGDVAGRGVQASAMMGKVRIAIDVIAMHEHDPACILDEAEYVLLQRYPDAMVTAFIAILDPGKRTIEYANAGHSYPLLRMWDGSIEPLTAQGMAIGLRALEKSERSRSRTLDGVAMIVFYTDGVTEATRDLEEGQRRLQAALASEATLYVRSPSTLLAVSCLPEDLHDDDAAILVVSFPHSISWSFDAEDARAAQHARGEFLEQLKSEAEPESDFTAAEIVFGELVGNVVRHAPGSIDVTLEWDTNGNGILHVIDRGPGFECVIPDEVDLLSESGRGLWLCNQFAKSIAVERLPGYGVHVRVELPVARKPSTISGARARRARRAATG